jgi:hypothetical protein
MAELLVQLENNGPPRARSSRATKSKGVDPLRSQWESMRAYLDEVKNIVPGFITCVIIRELTEAIVSMFPQHKWLEDGL